MAKLITWTPSARDRLDRYFRNIRPALAASGADPAEVIDDLRSHVERELDAAEIEAVTETDINHLLARIGAPEEVEAPIEEPNPPADSPKPKPKRHLLLLIFGVILPGIALGVELATHMCAGVFFDPLPTYWHAVLAGWVPLANALAWRKITAGLGVPSRWLGHANALAIGIAAYFALLYLPLLPLAGLAIVIFGWGLLPMAPLLSLISAGRLRGLLRAQVEHRPGIGRIGWGLAGAAGLVAMIALPPVATRSWARMAASDSPSTRASGLHWLRVFGHEKTLLSDAYGHTRWQADSLFHRFSRPLSTRAAREVYFRVTGRTFNSSPPPQLNFSRGGWDVFDQFVWDQDQGGTAVGGQLKDLWLASSRIDGFVEPHTAAAYTEWTLEFRNNASQMQEARAQIALPPGGVVSRLTLWVNGEEREAAFAGRSQTREAYTAIVQQRRDPVLVTSCGPDRVLLQCFPVPPQGGQMKVRIGITAPVALEAVDRGFLPWPHFLERNFGLPEQFQHNVWVESQQPVTAAPPALTSNRRPPTQHSLQGRLRDSELENPANALRCRLELPAQSTWTPDRDAPAVILQTLHDGPRQPASRIAIVIDGSAGMTPFYSLIADALIDLPPAVEGAVLVASDTIEQLSGDLPGVSSALRERHGQGGQDNLPALLQAWDWAAASDNAVVLWIHGPQPVTLSSAAPLRQKLDWHRDSPRLYDLQPLAGPNRILEELDGLAGLHSMRRSGELSQDLSRFLSALDGHSTPPRLERKRISKAELPTNALAPASRQIARLWAAEEIVRLQALRRVRDAVELAGAYQLVTAVSGAVVLETARQFAAAGLHPADAATVPSVPEPKHLTLLLLGTGVFILLRNRRPRARAGD